MGFLGSFLGGAAAGVVALGAIAGFYCKYWNPAGDESENFAFLEKEDDVASETSQTAEN